MLLLDQEEILSVYTMKDAIEGVKKAFRFVVEDACDAPLRTNIQVPDYDGSLLFMPAYAREMDTAVLKIINLFPHNIDQGLPSSPAQVLLIDGKTGIVSALMDGMCVTRLRTGAASGAAMDVLARKDAKIGALIGTGGQAATQLEAMLCARPLREVRVFDLNPERTKAFVEQMREKLAGYHADIIAAESSDAAIDNADMLVTVTPSRKPVFDGTKIKKGATVSCVGSYQYHMQEMDPVILTRASKIFFDSKEAVLSEAGDIRVPLDQGIITEDAFTGNLGDVLKGNLTGRENDDEIIVFKTVGVAAQDLVVAGEIYDKAVKAGIGSEW